MNRGLGMHDDVNLVRAHAKEPARFDDFEAFVHHRRGINGDAVSHAPVDSATMMNKGFEIIEARWLFGMRPDQIDVVVHPQSTIHSMVEFVDGSVLAQLGPTDMRMPIQYALTYPERVASKEVALDWTRLKRLDFQKASTRRVPCLRLAREAMKKGGARPCTLNAADEVAVAAFLERRRGCLGGGAVSGQARGRCGVRSGGGARCLRGEARSYRLPRKRNSSWGIGAHGGAGFIGSGFERSRADRGSG